jgi:hypothetical protein
VECWVRPAWTSSAASPLSSQDYSGSGQAGYIFYQNGQSGADQWEFRLGDGSGYVAIAAGGAVQTDVWQHLAGVYSGTNAVLYVNGIPTASAAVSRAFAPNRAQKFRLGANGDGIGQYFYLLNGDVDEVAVFNRALTAAEVSQRYQVAVSNPPLIASGTNFNYTSLIKTDLRPVMYGSNSTAYFRLPFVLTNAAAMKQLTLQLKYDDGFVAYLNGAQIAADNAPQPASWNSGALARRATSNALQFAQFDVSGGTNLLQNGTNVLALQGLNYAASNADFLLLAELDATAVGYDSVPHYLDLPTPGSANVATSGELGPLITFAEHTPAVPATNDSLSISCRVTKTLSDLASVTLNWRAMYGVTNQTPMFDDGLHGDGAAGDGIYGAFIDRTNYSAGQMVRWFITAADSLSRTSRWPLFPNPSDSAEYLGTVVQPEAVTTSALPVLHWFVENSSAAGTAAGTRCSLFYNGQFYDNVAVRIRGGSTARNWPKKCYKFNMNSGEKLFVRTDLPWVSAFDLNSTYSDKAYVRSVLTAEHQRDAGLPVMEEFHLHVRQNNQFFSVAIYVEQPNDDFLSRHGLDPEGALYKALGSPLGTYEKKTRLYEGNSDLQALTNGLNLAGTNLENFIFDNLDLADVVNYMATVAICQNIDASDKNHYLYRDSNGTREWRILPWDLDLTFGPDRNLTDTIVFNLCDTNTLHCPSHPFIGARPYLLQSGKHHPLLEAIVNTPRTRQMLLRRVRTLTDQFLAANYFQNRVEQLFPLLNPDVQLDQALWGANGNYPGQTYTLRQALDRVENEYLAPRVAFLAGTNIIGIGSNMPPSQPANAVIGISDLDCHPASGNQDEEYVCLTNANLFAVDVSGWTLNGGVQHTFEAGTVLPAGGALYVSPNAAAFRARSLAPHGGMGLFVQGNCRGHLNAWGESLTLTDTTGWLVSSNGFAAQCYTPGNLAVLRVGDGTQTLANSGNSLFLDQYSSSGLLVNTVTIPDSGTNALLLSGTATSEGGMTRSLDRTVLVLTGYNTNRGTVSGSLANTTGANVPRGVATIDAFGTYALAQASTNVCSGNNIRCGTTDGTNNYWTAGASSGTCYFNPPNLPITNQSSIANTRYIKAINDNLYFSTQSGTLGIYTFQGGGLPKGSATTSLLFGTGSSSQPAAFDMNPSLTVAYVADQRNSAGGIQKWTNDGGTWTLAYTFGTGGGRLWRSGRLQRGDAHCLCHHGGGQFEPAGPDCGYQRVSGGDCAGDGGQQPVVPWG